MQEHISKILCIYYSNINIVMVVKSSMAGAEAGVTRMPRTSADRYNLRTVQSNPSQPSSLNKHPECANYDTPRTQRCVALKRFFTSMSGAGAGYDVVVDVDEEGDVSL